MSNAKGRRHSSKVSPRTTGARATRTSKKQRAFEGKHTDQSIPTQYRRVTKTKQTIITYVLDTNVIMSAWDSIFKFHEHEVYLVGQVWKELDAHKKGNSPEAWNVRQAIRSIDKLLLGKNASDIEKGISLIPPAELINGKPHTGKLFFRFTDPSKAEGYNTNLDPSSPDDRIILTCLELKKEGKEVVLVSNDANCRIKALVAGLDAEEYLSDTVSNIVSEEDMSPGFHEMSSDFWDTCEDMNKNGETYTFVNEALKEVMPNEFLILPDEVILRVIKKIDEHTVIAREFSNLTHIEAMGIEPKNLEQAFALQLLMDTSLPAVFIAGLAGSGKNYLTLGAGLFLTLSKRVYKRIIFTRSTIDSDEAIGFLPGDEREKMSPWLGGLWDNIESLKKTQKYLSDAETRDLSIEDMVQIKSLNFMKGRSITDTLLIVDEAQDLAPKTLKMICTRLGEGSKIVLLGNVAQIDNPYLTSHTCGMSVLIRSFRDSSLVGHVTLQSGERSAFATLAEERL